MVEYYAEEDVPAKEEVVTTTKHKCIKPVEQPLLDPFPLPQNFCPDVELALKTDKMTATTSTAFYSQAAAALFGYKQYPSPEEFLRVAMDITKKKYPFLESLMQCGTEAVSR